jgi:hypothetical protein
MLDAYIIDAIRQRQIEEEERRRVRLELPIDRPRREPERARREEPPIGDPIVIPIGGDPEPHDEDEAA